MVFNHAKPTLKIYEILWEMEIEIVSITLITLQFTMIEYYIPETVTIVFIAGMWLNLLKWK